MKEVNDCPNCGAPLEPLDGKCGYCGYTFLLDEDELNKYPPEIRGRHYRNNGRFEQAVKAYHQWLLGQPANGLAVLEYLEFLVEYSQNQQFKNLPQIFVSSLNMLLYYQTEKRTFADQERAFLWLQHILELIQDTEYVAVDFEDYSYKSSADFFKAQESVILGEPVDQAKYNFYAIKYLQLFMTVFLGDEHAQKCLALPIADEKKMYGQEQLARLLMVEDVLRSRKARALNKEIPGQTDEFELVVVPMAVGFVRIAAFVICIAVAILFLIIGILGSNWYCLILGLIFLLGSIGEYNIYQFKESSRWIIRGISLVSGALLFLVPMIVFGIFLLIDFFAYERSKMMDAKGAEKQWQLYQNVEWLREAYQNRTVTRIEVFKQLIR
ncbi:zinc ribbon domain-containing protein [Culicoidibacter larvae]|uniref:Zinc ribbon domain-containing protein n=1 Tax=Culicoidibacter larvae TaxID=2579976 RepID=A0A5R8QHP3_9FIRM|nr:zinc ribbon domain-containing protein [Culicoidibacter larvae]TLG76787.1 zinc ribbon domain-containing protein [Culicoidibacter larvae]